MACSPGKRRERPHQQHRERGGERPQLAPDVEVGGDRLLEMPKLWRAPMPMVRITAPEITPIQKLRDAAGGDEADTAIECLTLVTRRMLVTPP